MAPSRSPEERMLTAGVMFSLADTDPAAHPDLLARAMCVVSLSLSLPLSSPPTRRRSVSLLPLGDK